MFLGTYFPKLDEKGRFFLPAKFREELADGLVITRGEDRCLAIYTPEAFLRMAEHVTSGPTTVKSVRDLQRMLAANAADEAPDRQGRVSIPQQLREYAGLDKEIVVIGSMTRVEVWDAVAWGAYSAAQEEVFADMNDEVIPGQ